ncbi:MAG TPA: ABATE domain-containing protein [Bradyrhizobium sp.]|jgi:predicted RNA-binding Zn ribbon-like protein
MPDNRPPAMFIADAPGLDFLNSIATPDDTPVEWLASGEDLLAWLKEADLIPAAVPRALKKSAVPGELDAVAAQARALREWFREFVDERRGKPLQPDALKQLEPLNRILAREEEFGQIAARDHHHPSDGDQPVSGLVWVPHKRWRSPDTLLLPIAKAIADLVCNEDFTYIKACEGAACTLLFFDRTRGRVRRWCSMAVCGNRSKQTAHRERIHQVRSGRTKRNRE